MRTLLLWIGSTFLMSGLQAFHSPTWTKDIAPILYKNCTSCHHPGGLAPFSLITYDDAYFNRYSLANSVTEKRMPPWPPIKGYGNFAHERLLTDDEIHLIEEWVDGGAVGGNPGDAPTPPVYSGSATMGNADLVLTMPQYTIPDLQGKDLYRCFVLPSTTTVDQFIHGIECIPGNAEVVHHVLIFQDATSKPLELDAADPAPGYSAFGSTGSSASTLIGAWVPGQGVSWYPEAFGIRLKAKTNIILQVHYPYSASGATDATQVRFKFSKASNVREVTVTPILNHGISLENGPLVIPANTIKTFYSKFTVPANVSVLSIAPHMHLIGKSIKVYGVTLAKDTLPLINIPHWDFHWQGAYLYKYLQRLPFGTVLRGEAVYDNTEDNPNNPSAPPQTVTAGEATTDEMMLVYFAYTPYQPGDEQILLETSLPTSSPTVQTLVTTAGPNPVQGNLEWKIQLPEAIKQVELKWFDATGKLLSTGITSSSNGTIAMQSYESGVYFIQWSAPGWYGVQRIVKQ